jgi:predicted nuclease with TOPRIM domain
MPPEDISVQILSQTSENIQKLFELSTRIDERVKEIQNKQAGFHDRLEKVISGHQEMLQKVAVLESKDGSALIEDVDECKKEMASLDKRITVVEGSTDQSKDRWNRIFTFVIQLVWVLLAAWLLVKLNLQAPAVP